MISPIFGQQTSADYCVKMQPRGFVVKINLLYLNEGQQTLYLHRFKNYARCKLVHFPEEFWPFGTTMMTSWWCPHIHNKVYIFRKYLVARFTEILVSSSSYPPRNPTSIKKHIYDRLTITALGYIYQIFVLKL